MEFRRRRFLRLHRRFAIAAMIPGLAAAAVVPLVVTAHGHAAALTAAVANGDDNRGSASGLGPLSGLLPDDNLVLKSALQVDLSRETVRLPLFKGKANGQTVWYVVTEASDAGLAHDLNANYAPKLANLTNLPPIDAQDPVVQTVHLEAPTVAQNPFGPAVVDFQGAPDFSHPRVLVPGPDGFPPAKADPGAVAGPGYSPFIRIAGSPNVVYNAPIVATGDGPFDVVHHTNTHGRALAINIAPPSPPGQYLQSTVDLLLVKGFDAGQPILYLSTESNDKTTATLERSTYVPGLSAAAFNGGDDFLGSARERLFAFVNGQTGADNTQAQGIRHLIVDGHASEDASAGNTALIDALRNGGDLLNVFGDFPTLTDPRHALAYSPLWEPQFGQWTQKAIDQGLNKRQIDENQVFNLAASRPDLITGPGGAPYGGQGVVVNCAVIGFTLSAPTANLATPLPNSQH